MCAKYLKLTCNDSSLTQHKKCYCCSYEMNTFLGKEISQVSCEQVTQTWKYFLMSLMYIKCLFFNTPGILNESVLVDHYTVCHGSAANPN